MTPLPPLTAAEKNFLRDLALASVSAAAHGQEPTTGGDFAAGRGFTPGPSLLASRGAFVTLTREGHLRGCIGYIEGICSLLDAVARNARAAACEDPRFLPLTPGELEGLEVEISALTPLIPLADPAGIELGRHGVLLSAGGRRAVFLPQVAVEEGWDRPTMLHHLCIKAGLAPDSWRDGARFQVFEADVF